MSKIDRINCRIEYDAYRMDLESSKGEAPATNGEDTQTSYTKHKENYEKLRADVAVKMQFLDENRVSTEYWLIVKSDFLIAQRLFLFCNRLK